MFAALIKLIPFRDYAYAALAILAVIWFVHHDHKVALAAVVHEQQTVAQETQKTLAAATATIARINSTYTAQTAVVEKTYAAALTASATQHDLDVQRLRDAARAESHSGTRAGSTAAAGPADNSGDQSSGQLGTVPAQLAQEQVDALRLDDAALVQCYAERDELTGK